MKDPYKVLGVDSSASFDEMKEKYDKLHAEYSEQMFAAGEVGNEGARKLQELDEAWESISASRAADSVSAPDGKDDYKRIDEFIRDGKYNEAQDVLDSVQDRGGEWHYMQAIVFYKREWLGDAKTQLEMALRCEPNNAKYRSSLDKLNMAMGIGGQEKQNNPPPRAAQPQNTTYDDGQQSTPANDMSNCLSTACCAYCLTDCLCNSMRCC